MGDNITRGVSGGQKKRTTTGRHTKLHDMLSSGILSRALKCVLPHESQSGEQSASASMLSSCRLAANTREADPACGWMAVLRPAICTAGDITVGPCGVLLMDEITTGLDSSNAFTIVQCFAHEAHHRQSTILMSLLQPAPEVFNLFDDIMLLAEGRCRVTGDVISICNPAGTTEGAWQGCRGLLLISATG